MFEGLSTIQAEKRLEEVGRNEPAPPSSFSPVRLFLSQFPTFMNGVLLIASVFSFLTGDLIDSIFILSIIVLNGFFSFFQEYRAERAIARLSTYTKEITRVIRDGKECEVETATLVPDDIVVLSEGERIPADGVLVSSRHLEIDESLLTGESLPIMKEANEQAFTGTLIIKGRGHLKITATGVRTKLGQIATTLTHIKANKTPLQKQIIKLGRVLSALAIGISLLVLPFGLFQGNDLRPLFLLAVSIGIAAIPEGLTAVITIALALGSAKLAKKKAIVRKMPSIETLGATQFLLVDKTGTLTENKMRVKKHWLTHKDYLAPLLQACVLGNTASVVETNSTSSHIETIGDTTDGALLSYASVELPHIHTIINEGTVVDEFVFDTKTKTVTTVWDSFKRRFVFVRGAPEAVLASSIVSSAQHEKIQEAIEEFAKEGMRVIAFGYKTESHHGELNREHLESKLTFLGIVGIYDPPRHEVKEAIRAARHAGITTIMITGDNELTALAIAKEIGLIEKDEDVLTGTTLNRMTDEELTPLLGKIRVVARSEPQDKLRITTLLQKQGFVVGVTGDGVNDALALQKADVGIAMGLSGTDVAKEASDIVIADDNFKTIISAIHEGRSRYKSIVKSIVYLLSSNFSELLLVLIGTILGLPSVLLPTQILWINIVTDGVPALALATDATQHSLLSEKPRDPKEAILTKQRIFLIVTIGLIISLALISLYIFLLSTQSVAFARTIVFNALVFSHLTLAFILRGKSFFKMNKLLVFGTIAILILQLLVTAFPETRELLELSV